MARSELPSDVFKSLRNALLNMKDETVLKPLGVSGFFPSSDKEYAFVRDGMQQSKKFDIKKVVGRHLGQ